ALLGALAVLLAVFVSVAATTARDLSSPGPEGAIWLAPWPEMSVAHEALVKSKGGADKQHNVLLNVFGQAREIRNLLDESHELVRAGEEVTRARDKPSQGKKAARQHHADKALAALDRTHRKLDKLRQRGLPDDIDRQARGACNAISAYRDEVKKLRAGNF